MNKMKKMKVLLGTAVVLSGLVICSGCADSTKESGTKTESKKMTIAIPDDASNEARALMLLEKEGYIALNSNAGITATIKDIKDNMHNVEFKEVEAAKLPEVLPDVDYAIINSNYAISAKLDPVKDSLALEGSSSAYSNIVAVKAGNEQTDKTKALVAALESQKVKDYIESNYNGSVVSTVDMPGDGYAKDVDYTKLAGMTITVAASPAPHAEILKIAQEILKAKNVNLEIKEYEDYVVPNTVVESGEVDANYFQHVPYLDDFNKENNTHIVSVSAVHVEPMGIYSSKHKDLKEIEK